MNVETDGQQKNPLFSPKASPIGKPGYSPRPSLGKSPGLSPKSSPVKKSPSKQEKPKNKTGYCCLGMKSPSSPTHNPTIKGHQLDEEVKEHQRRESRVTFLTKVHEYIRNLFFASGGLLLYTKISPRISSPVMGSPNLATMTAQARINGWHIEPQEIELYDQVGRGSTADIYRGSWKGLQVAVKWMNPEYFHFNENGVAFFVQEIETLSKQRHPFVLRLVGACLNPPNHGWVVTEFLSTTLKEWLHGSGNKRVKRSLPLPPLHERLAKALETAQAMQYLHGQKPRLIHRDLKPSNIFMDDARHIRVADFGHARFLSEGERAFTGETGTYVYMAPEVIRCEAYNEKCDVFSFGVILNELITGEHPYIETDYGPTEIALGVSEGKIRPALPEDDGQSGELIQLICHSWDEDASIRPSFAVIASTLKRIQGRLTSVR